jgi:fibronectin type III domain protein
MTQRRSQTFCATPIEWVEEKVEIGDVDLERVRLRSCMCSARSVRRARPGSGTCPMATISTSIQVGFADSPGDALSEAHEEAERVCRQLEAPDRTGRLMVLRCDSTVALVATTAFIFAGCAVKEGVLRTSWTPPTTNTDGSPLTDLASYRIYFSTVGPPCPDGRSITIDAATGVSRAPDQRVSVRLTNLTVGQIYYVAVTAVNSGGVSSLCSNTASGRGRRPE